MEKSLGKCMPVCSSVLNSFVCWRSVSINSFRVWMRRSSERCFAWSVLQCAASRSFTLSNSNWCMVDSGKNFISEGQWSVRGVHSPWSMVHSRSHGLNGYYILQNVFVWSMFNFDRIKICLIPFDTVAISCVCNAQLFFVVQVSDTTMLRSILEMLVSKNW